MKIVELYLRVRQSVFVEGRSRRETARLFGIARKTVDGSARFRLLLATGGDLPRPGRSWMGLPVARQSG